MPVPSIVSWLDENWQTVECQFYGGIQQGAFTAAYTSAFTGKFPLALGLAGISYAAGWTAEQVGCNYREPESDNEPAIGGCMKIGQGAGRVYFNRIDRDPPGALVATNVVEIKRIEEYYQAPIAKWNWRAVYVRAPLEDGSQPEDYYQFPKESTRFPIATLVPYADATCEIPAPEAGPGEHNPGDPIADPINHVIGSCNWTIQATDAYVDDQLRMHTYYTITARDETCGGPFAYWSSDKGPQWVAPEPPYNPDNPDEPGPPLPPPDYNPRFDDIDDDLDKVKDELEKLKECACPETPVIEGEYRTISFRAEETSPYGSARLRKRFKYRSQSGLDLGAVIDHWKDFSFTAGAVIVWHSGSNLGSPKVWAASVDEGKRVIRHAAGEAGIDPDQVGKWGVSGSNHARYGVPGTMKVDTTGGYYWITARDGEDGRPIVGRLRSDS
jgi:hypothetical protein